jgi:hypothetical protein
VKFLVSLLIFSGLAISQTSFMDTFDTDVYWNRTGGTGDGIYEALDGAYAHTYGAHCSYYRWAPGNLEFGQGVYEFDVYGPFWEFAWRIETGSSSGGTCHRLGHYPDIFGGYFVMLSANWNGSNYSWQSSDWGDQYSFDGPDPEGLHHVEVHDFTNYVSIYIDDAEVFSSSVTPITTGTIGLGCGNTPSSPSDHSPWYDNVSYDPGVGIEIHSWGAIKALF